MPRIEAILTRCAFYLGLLDKLVAEHKLKGKRVS